MASIGRQMEAPKDNGSPRSFKEKAISFGALWTPDLARIGILLFVIGYLLVQHDASNTVIIQALGIGLFLVGGSHLTRRILFYRLDLQSIAREAIEEKNMPAAVIFAAIMFFLVAVMFLSMSVLK